MCVHVLWTQKIISVYCKLVKFQRILVLSTCHFSFFLKLFPLSWNCQQVFVSFHFNWSSSNHWINFLRWVTLYASLWFKDHKTCMVQLAFCKIFKIRKLSLLSIIGKLLDFMSQVNSKRGNYRPVRNSHILMCYGLWITVMPREMLGPN